MNLCQRGHELLMDLKRSDFLPPYDEEGVRLVLSEITEIHGKASDIMTRCAEFVNQSGATPARVEATFLYYEQCINRNRRYLNRYHKIKSSNLSLVLSTAAIRTTVVTESIFLLLFVLLKLCVSSYGENKKPTVVNWCGITRENKTRYVICKREWLF